MRSPDLCDRLIDFDSERLDLELISILGENYISKKQIDLQSLMEN